MALKLLSRTKSNTLPCSVLPPDLGHCVHGGAGRHPIARVSHAVLGLELLHRVGERHRVAGVVLRIVVVAAVDEIHRAVAGAASDGDGHGVRILAVVGQRRVLDRGTRQDDELQHAAAVQRQADDLFLAHHRADVDVASFDEAGVGLHRHGFRQAADFQVDVDRSRIADGEDDAGLFEDAEATQLRGELVGSDGQVGEDVAAAFVADDEAGHCGIGVSDGDFDAWEGASRFIQDRTGELSHGYGLSFAANR